MTRVDENRRKANYAAAYVTAKLSTGCLVRPVAADTDIGVDLYCESIENGYGHLHFWLQVKSGAARIREDGDRGTAKCRFDSAHLTYWARQPVPVFAALVPLQWPIALDLEPSVYVVDLTSYLLCHGVPEQGGRTLTSTHVWPPGDAGAITDFLQQAVPSVTAAQRCSQGLVASVPTLRPEYAQTYPALPIQRYEESILRQLRTTAALSIVLAWNSGDLKGLSPGGRRTLAAIVAQFEGDPHYENYMARALSHHADQEYAHAENLYRTALQYIWGDPKVRDRPHWQANAHVLEGLAAKAHNREDL